jgi:two-component system chemotaxis response regulator CheB
LTPHAVRASGAPAGQKLVAIGTSTGGPQALQSVITQLPGDLPCGVVVVQHMPPGFTKALADRLNTISAIKVKEAEDGEIIQPGQVYIAPGNYHMRIASEGRKRKIVLGQDPPVGNHRPAVNVMFDSVAPIGRELVAVIMTGMGCDGCEGMKKIKANGGYSIAQDEASCVVYGMPKAVVDAGLADEVRPVQNIARAIVEAVKK